MISDEAVKAARKVAYERYGSQPDANYLRVILEAAAPYMLTEVQRKLDEATRVVAILTLKAGGRVSVSSREMTTGYESITTTPNVLTGALDISVR